MRILLTAALLAVSTPVLAQGNPAVGPCAGAAALDSATQASLVSKPDRKPRRKDNGVEPVAQNSHFQMLNSSDDRDLANTGPTKWIVATAVIDTTGHVDPRTASIEQSSSIVLSHAVCDALTRMAFVPAELKGQKVPALYKERFIFRLSVTDVGQNPNGNGGDRH